jgi:hypothetical protein
LQPPPSVPVPTSIQSESQADQALAELCDLAATEATAQAICDRGIEACREVCARKLFINDYGDPVSFADRRRHLESELCAFVWNNAELLFQNPKSRDLNHGRLGLRLTKPTVEEIPAPEGEKKSAWATVRDKMRTFLLKAFARIRLGAGKAAPALFSIKVEANKTSMLTAFKSKAIKPAQLARLGFRHVPETNEFFFELADLKVESHSAEAPSASAASPQSAV